MVYDKWLAPSWCDRPSIKVAPDLIGCTLVRQLPNGGPTIRGIIVETEAYAPGDPACHAYHGKSKRNAAMFGPPGHTYVYLIYGMYHCLNVVTEPQGTGSAVLIRAIQLERIPPQLLTPQAKQAQTQQTQTQQTRRTKPQKPHRIAAGPGKLCRTLEIDRSLDAVLYHPDNGLWIEPRTQPLSNQDLVKTTRIGITKAADKTWRWYLASSPAVSKKASAR